MKKLFFSLMALFALLLYGNAQNTSPYWSLAGNSNATSSSKLGTTNSVTLRFFTKNLERLRIDTSGRVGIGTTTPDSRLQVNTTTAGQNAFRAQVNGSTKLLVDDGGGVSVGSSTTPPVNGLYVSGSAGIGTATPSYKLHVVTTGTAIYGNSTGGYYGVWGNSTYAGVYGTGTSYGVIGSGSYGVYGTGSSYGLYGSGGTYGVYGYGSSYGVYGYSGSNYGVYGNAGYIGVYGSGSASSGYGLAGAGNYGVSGVGAYIGVFGQSTNGTAVVGNCANGTGGNFYSDNGYGIVAGTKRSDKNYAGVFNGNVYAYGTYQGSDIKLKKNIEDVGDAMAIINQLKPKRYEFQKEGKLASLNLPSGKHYGLIAQDLEEVLPELVKEITHDLNNPKIMAEPAALPDSSNAIKKIGQKNTTLQTEPRDILSTKAVNYTELIPILIKGMQELYADKDKKINELQLQIDELKAMVQTLKQGGNIPALSNGFLKQNAPNPANGNTVISYYIPDNAGSAQIKITDVKGSLIKTFSAAKGEGQINIKSGQLPAGTYNYTLYINSKTVDTRQMILIK